MSSPTYNKIYLGLISQQALREFHYYYLFMKQKQIFIEEVTAVSQQVSTPVKKSKQNASSMEGEETVPRNKQKYFSSKAQPSASIKKEANNLNLSNLSTVDNTNNKDDSDTEGEMVTIKQKARKNRSKQKKQEQESELPKPKKVIRKKSSKTSEKGKKSSRQIRSKSVYIFESIYEKILISFILSIISMVFFTKPAHIAPSSALQELIVNSTKNVFELTVSVWTLSKSYPMSETYKVSEYLPFLESTKTATLDCKIRLRLGYEVESFDMMADSMYHQSNHIKMSKLKILSAEIVDPIWKDKQNGIFNSWEVEDSDAVMAKILKEKIFGRQQEIIGRISSHQRFEYEKKTQKMLETLVNEYQSWFNWALRRLDGYIDHQVAPYVQAIQQR